VEEGRGDEREKVLARAYLGRDQGVGVIKGVEAPLALDGCVCQTKIATLIAIRT
jgi:hypothetical protein